MSFNFVVSTFVQLQHLVIVFPLSSTYKRHYILLLNFDTVFFTMRAQPRQKKLASNFVILYSAILNTQSLAKMIRKKFFLLSV